MSLIESSCVCVSLSSSSPSLHRLPVSGGHVEAGDHHQVGFAEVDSSLQFVRHGLQSLQILQRVHFMGRLYLNCTWKYRQRYDVETHCYTLIMSYWFQKSGDLSYCLQIPLKHQNQRFIYHSVLTRTLTLCIQSLIVFLHINEPCYCTAWHDYSLQWTQRLFWFNTTYTCVHK